MIRRKRKTEKRDQQQKEGPSLITAIKPNSVVAEQSRTIRTNIQFSMIDRDLKTIIFTSSGPWEGNLQLRLILPPSLRIYGETYYIGGC